MNDNGRLVGQSGYDDLWHYETQEDVDAYYARWYGDVVGVGQPGIHYRLRGARLAAGFVYVSVAARKFELTESTYRHAEDGLRPVNETLAQMAVEFYGVDLPFLLEGVPHTERDKLAERLAEVISRVKAEDNLDAEELDELYEGFMVRLREMRIAEGHLSPSAAAIAHGWNRSTYWQHEAGMNGISVDRMIAYSLTMGCRPEWAVLGEGPRQEPSNLDWKEQPRDAIQVATSHLPTR